MKATVRRLPGKTHNLLVTEWIPDFEMYRSNLSKSPFPGRDHSPLDIISIVVNSAISASTEFLLSAISPEVK